TLDLLDDRGHLLRRMSGLTSQAMLSRARLDPRPDLDILPPSGTWTWDIDLASYHYNLPAGDLQIEAHYTYPPKGIDVRADRVPVRIAAQHLDVLTADRDNPVLDAITLLLLAEDPPGRALYLRQLNHPRPLAAWYSERIADGGPGRRYFLASANFFRTDS